MNYHAGDEDYLDRNFTTSDLNDTAFPPLSAYPPKRAELYIVIPLTILYSLILLAGLIGNVVTCIVIARNKHMHNATNYYLFSLAVSDLLLLVTGMPVEIYYLWSRYPYVFGETFCVLRGLAAETSTNATVLTITAFTVERYFAICHPFWSHSLSKLSRAIRLILIIWIIALLCAIPQAMQFGVVFGHTEEYTVCTVETQLEHAFEISTFLFFVTPMTLISILYALIGFRLRRSAVMKRSTSSQDSQYSVASAHASASYCKQNRSSQRVLKMLVAVVVAFFICWAPFHVQRLVAIYTPGSDHHTVYAIVTYTSGILYYLSTTVNPILYHIMSFKFREAFKETLSRCCCETEQRPYSQLSKQKRLLGGSSKKFSESLTEASSGIQEMRTQLLFPHQLIIISYLIQVFRK
uniref:Neuropeptides capa receptor n=1 Tax=Cacopsylla melanoneura TaxID=428564 RepID=A0A8D9E5A1_9HEMI